MREIYMKAPVRSPEDRNIISQGGDAMTASDRSPREIQ